MRLFSVGLFALVLGLGACASTSSANAYLRRRAAFDLQCKQTDVRVIPISYGTRGVRGCNRQATYVRTCRGEPLFEQCTWVLNGAVQPIVP